MEIEEESTPVYNSGVDCIELTTFNLNNEYLGKVCSCRGGSGGGCEPVLHTAGPRVDGLDSCQGCCATARTGKTREGMEKAIELEVEVGQSAAGENVEHQSGRGENVAEGGSGENVHEHHSRPENVPERRSENVMKQVLQPGMDRLGTPPSWTKRTSIGSRRRAFSGSNTDDISSDDEGAARSFNTGTTMEDDAYQADNEDGPSRGSSEDEGDPDATAKKSPRNSRGAAMTEGSPPDTPATSCADVTQSGDASHPRSRREISKHDSIDTASSCSGREEDGKRTPDSCGVVVKRIYRSSSLETENLLPTPRKTLRSMSVTFAEQPVKLRQRNSASMSRTSDMDFPNLSDFDDDDDLPYTLNPMYFEPQSPGLRSSFGDDGFEEQPLEEQEEDENKDSHEHKTSESDATERRHNYSSQTSGYKTGGSYEGKANDDPMDDVFLPHKEDVSVADEPQAVATQTQEVTEENLQSMIPTVVPTYRHNSDSSLDSTEVKYLKYSADFGKTNRTVSGIPPHVLQDYQLSDSDEFSLQSSRSDSPSVLERINEQSESQILPELDEMRDDTNEICSEMSEKLTLSSQNVPTSTGVEFASNRSAPCSENPNHGKTDFSCPIAQKHNQPDHKFPQISASTENEDAPVPEASLVSKVPGTDDISFTLSKREASSKHPQSASELDKVPIAAANLASKVSKSDDMSFALSTLETPSNLPQSASDVDKKAQVPEASFASEVSEVDDVSFTLSMLETSNLPQSTSVVDKNAPVAAASLGSNETEDLSVTLSMLETTSSSTKSTKRPDDLPIGADPGDLLNMWEESPLTPGMKNLRMNSKEQEEYYCTKTEQFKFAACEQALRDMDTSPAYVMERIASFELPTSDEAHNKFYAVGGTGFQGDQGYIRKSKGQSAEAAEHDTFDINESVDLVDINELILGKDPDELEKQLCIAVRCWERKHCDDPECKEGRDILHHFEESLKPNDTITSQLDRVAAERVLQCLQHHSEDCDDTYCCLPFCCHIKMKDEDLSDCSISNLARFYDPSPVNFTEKEGDCNRQQFHMLYKCDNTCTPHGPKMIREMEDWLPVLYSGQFGAGNEVLVYPTDEGVNRMKAAGYYSTTPWVVSKVWSRGPSHQELLKTIGKIGENKLISTLLWALEQDKVMYICREFNSGISLSDCLHDGPIPASMVLPFFYQLVSAAHYLHQMNIVFLLWIASAIELSLHRDTVKLSNFSAARYMMEDDLEDIALSLPPKVVPPEFLQEPVGPLSPVNDSWGLGHILYQMKTGRHYFHQWRHSEPWDVRDMVKGLTQLDVPEVLAECGTFLKCLWLVKPSSRRSAGDIVKHIVQPVTGSLASRKTTEQLQS